MARDIVFNQPRRLYKYRSLENLERFLSIIIDRKLYGALYSEMNDPMEGYYQYDPSVDKDLIKTIFEGKQKHYICSLSKRGNIGLMWTHYSDENKGCCLELEVTSKTWEELPVIYEDHLPILRPGMTAKDVLKVKAKVWAYEEEVRYLSPEISKGKDRPELSVRIHRIFIGYNVDRRKKAHLKKIIHALDDKIEVIMMHKEDLDYGFDR